MAFDRIGAVVGLTAEARIARRLFDTVAVGGGTPAGAEAAARRLIGQGVRGLVSFGLAGGLDPLLRPGAVIVPEAVTTQGQQLDTDPDLNARLGGATPHALFGGDRIAVTATAKQHLFVATGCAAIDLESGALALVAQAHGIPFAVLRAICDGGAIGLLRVIGSVLVHPGQVPALLALGRDAQAARRALMARVS